MHVPKKALFYCLVPCLFLSWFGCQSKRSNSPNYSISSVDGIFIDSLSSNGPDSGRAICIYDRAALRRLPTKKRYPDGEDNFITTIWYGETVEYLNEIKEVEKEKTKFIRVRLGDGNEGWVFQYAFETNAQRGAMLKPAPLYRRPDLMTLRNDTLQPAEIVAVLERRGDWLQVSGRNKDKKGWIQVGDNISLREKDVYIALLWYKARTAARKNRADKVANVLNDPNISGSLLKDLVESEYNAQYGSISESSVPLEDDNPLGEDLGIIRGTHATRLFVTDLEVNVHSSPESVETNVLTRLKHGDVCLVLEQGESANIGEVNDYWYKVAFDGQEGWIFGYYTSLRTLN